MILVFIIGCAVGLWGSIMGVEDAEDSYVSSCVAWGYEYEVVSGVKHMQVVEELPGQVA